MTGLRGVGPLVVSRAVVRTGIAAHVAPLAVVVALPGTERPCTSS